MLSLFKINDVNRFYLADVVCTALTMFYIMNAKIEEQSLTNITNNKLKLINLTDEEMSKIFEKDAHDLLNRLFLKSVIHVRTDRSTGKYIEHGQHV